MATQDEPQVIQMTLQEELDAAKAELIDARKRSMMAFEKAANAEYEHDMALEREFEVREYVKELEEKVAKESES